MNKTKTKNKRAFTLTELLIVVIVIGVLSAVTLPKFNRVIENRKVTEAEEMMSAVRMEQERRCTLDQNYTTNFSNLSDVIASANTKNYTYSLQSQGISARSASGDYTLKILSYEDGSYCCTGTGCKKLNKNYPDCATLSFPTSNCAGTEGGTGEPGTDPGETPECADGEVQGSQACNGCGVQTTQKCVNGKWTNVLGTCSKTAEECAPECTDGAVSGSQTCNGCGTQTTRKCVGGKWTNVLGTCSKTEEECTPEPECEGNQPADAIKQCECGTVSASYRCDASTNYQWVQGEFPECPAKPDDITETCSDGKTVRTKTYTCVNNTWTLGNWDKECPEADPCANETQKTQWSTKYNRCICPSGSDASGLSAYVNGSCCNLTTPKTNSACWKAGGSWTWQEKGTSSYEGYGGGFCEVSQGRYTQLGGTHGGAAKCTASAGSACSSSGAVCISSCSEQCIRDCAYVGLRQSRATYSFMVCLQDPTSYSLTWVPGQTLPY